MWRNEVNMRKRERTRQQAEELRKMQKLFLLKAMSSPGKVVAEQPDEVRLRRGRVLTTALHSLAQTLGSDHQQFQVLSYLYRTLDLRLCYYWVVSTGGEYWSLFVSSLD